jgi:hypothetical protein
MCYKDFKIKEFIKCTNCGEDAEIDTTMILASYPPQYQWRCPHCGAIGYTGMGYKNNFPIDDINSVNVYDQNSTCAGFGNKSNEIEIRIKDIHYELDKKSKVYTGKTNYMLEE